MEPGRFEIHQRRGLILAAKNGNSAQRFGLRERTVITLIISVKNLQKQFQTYERGSSLGEVVRSLFIRKQKTITALKDISFEVDEGELLGFIGPNGAGKSTTLKILTGVLHPTAGEVNVMGYVPWQNRRKYVSGIGAVFGQKSQLYMDVPPNDAFRLNKAIYDIPDHEYNENLNLMVELLGVQDVIRKPTRQLSLGERMKCEFIMSMLHNPKIVFLDEPTIGLDVVAKEKIRDFIRQMNEKGVTFILTTHDVTDVERLAKRVIVINEGTIVFDDSMSAMKKHLGNKKLVKLTLEDRLPEFNLLGVTVRDVLTEREAEIEIDYDRVDINEFIAFISQSSRIEDITINELPVEKIIIDLYGTDSRQTQEQPL